MASEKSFCVTEDEVVASDNNIQPVMQVLKDKGAPIEGMFYLELASGYSILKHQCSFCFGRVYVFRKEN